MRFVATVDMEAEIRDAESRLDRHLDKLARIKEPANHLREEYTLKEQVARDHIAGQEPDHLLVDEAALSKIPVKALAEKIIANADKRQEEVRQRALERRAFVLRLRAAKKPADIKDVLTEAGIEEKKPVDPLGGVSG
jgi:hypothetical protein